MKNRTFLSRLTIILCLLLFTVTTYGQYDIPEVPTTKEQKPVHDYIGLLTDQQYNYLNTKLKNYADTTSTQIVVAIISTTLGEDISFLGAKWGQKWGVGQKDKDNGILIILAKDDRKVDINTGYGIEYIVSDRTAEQIINRKMVPKFKNGDYYGGLDNGTDALIDALSGEYKEDRKNLGELAGYNLGIVLVVMIFVIFFIILYSGSKNNRGGKGGGKTDSLSDILDVIILSNMGRTGGWGSGNSSSGGFGGGGSFGGGGGFGGGFGGGGFGGGGASGGW